jgi:aquaporin Z
MSIITPAQERLDAGRILRANWQIYAMDGALLGMFMISACVSVVIVEYPSSPLRHVMNSELLRRALIGTAMGFTAVALIYSPWGKRSGAHMNPAMTLSFLRLGKINLIDASGYVIGQFLGGALGMMLCAIILGPLVRHPSVGYVVTVPGLSGILPAWLGEFVIAMLMMLVVMSLNKRPTLAPYTGYFAATLVALYITFESPLSGMSLNPARTFASSIVAWVWTGWWIYLSAPVLGMLAGIELHRLITSEHQRLCGKLSHDPHVNCFIRCNCLLPGKGRS